MAARVMARMMARAMAESRSMREIVLLVNCGGTLDWLLSVGLGSGFVDGVVYWALLSSLKEKTLRFRVVIVVYVCGVNN